MKCRSIMLQTEQLDSSEAFVKLGKQIDKIISDGISGLSIFQQYLKKRLQLENEFSTALEDFLKKHPYDHTSAMTLIFDEIEAVFDQHKELGNIIRNQFIPPIDSFTQYVQKEQKLMSQNLSATVDTVKLIERKICIAEAKYETVRLESLNFTSSKSNKLKRQVRDLQNEVNACKQTQKDHFSLLRQKEVPKFLTQTADIDFGIRTTIKNSMLNLSATELRTLNDCLCKLEAVEASSQRFEPAAETQGFVKSLGIVKQQTRTYAVARSDYISDDIGDLPLLRGQFIEVTQQHPSGWWEGDCNNRHGIFPSTYVDIITDPGTGGFTIHETFEIIDRYLPRNDTELELDVGDIVFVTTLNDGWCEGHKIDDPTIGKFPAQVVLGIRNLYI